MEAFRVTFDAISKRSQENANKRAPQHICWLKSPRVLHAFDVCDQKDPISGEALSAQVFQCIFGMEGSPVAEGILTEWAAATKVKRENLLLRAFTRDQNGVNNAVDKTLPEITENATGTTEFVIAPATSWQSATKGLIGAMKATDSALDEWMRQQGPAKNYLNPKHIANVEARCFYFVSTLTRAVARKGIGGKLDIAFVARANALLFSRLGDLAAKLEYETLNARIDPSKWNYLQARHEQAEAQAKMVEARKTSQQRYAYRVAQRAKAELEHAAVDLIRDAQCKAKLHIAMGAKSLGWGALLDGLEESARQHRNYEEEAEALAKKRGFGQQGTTAVSPTNNYHHIRIGASLAAIESLALFSKISGLNNAEFKLAAAEIFASATSVAAIVTDMMYTYTKSVRELPHFAAIDGINQGADIVRGGFKITAGLLAATAGGFTAWNDWRKSYKQEDPVIKAIYRVRSVHGLISSGVSLVIAYSYTAPLLKHLAAMNGRSSLARLFLLKGQKGAKWLSRRVIFLRIAAWLGWIGVAITIVDLSYAAYRSYVDHTAVTRWLNRCTFRRQKNYRGFATVNEELEEFHLALHPPH
jgi:hypothetical protein